MEETNTFEKLDSSNIHKQPVQEQKQTPISAPMEIAINMLSDVAPKDQVKYQRPDLNGKEDIIDRFQVMTPDYNEEPTPSQSGTSFFWKVPMILTYKSVNQDEIQNKEWISGARVFRNADGTPSPNISFWYKGSETQSAYLWELVADAKGIEPEELSPREFVVFLNSSPKVTIAGLQYKNYKAPAGAPAKMTKNMPCKFN